MWFLLGLTVGALVGVLYAPQSGEETRGMLRDKAGEGREKFRGKAEEWRQQAGGLRTQASDIADRGRAAVTRQIDQFQAAVEAGKQAYREAAGMEPKHESGPQL
ncbi:MAG TPA: YtxH domain-containing protein [Terriglobales bacterium]|nr:YtxH domain-containing protein [Terriglobales bacterium]